MRKKKNTIHREHLKTLLAGVLSVCLVLGLAALPDPAYAVSTVSPYTGGTYTHNARFDNCVIANGVDVSYWQNADSDWVAAKAAGIDYAILRVTYSGGLTRSLSLGIDSKFAGFYANCKNAGIMTGVYVFSQAKDAEEAVREADFAVQRLKALGIGPGDLQLPVYMDYEFYGGILGRLHGLTRANATEAAVAFCSRIASYGYQPGIYASLTFFNGYIDTGRLGSNVDIWCAQYNTSCGLATNYSKWQYSSGGKVEGLKNLAGLSGRIDMDFWYLDRRSDISPAASINLSGDISYSGGPVRPTVTVTSGGRTLRQGVDYVCGYINNINQGAAAYVYVKGIGSYSGYKIVPFQVGGVLVQNSPSGGSSFVTGTSIASLTGGSRSFTVRVKKKSAKKVNGYELRYSRKKSMANAVTKTIGKKNARTSKTVKNLKKNKKYYVQVRAFQYINGMTYYSDWSKSKKVKTR